MKSREDLPKEIAVLMGGPGSERDVSLATGRGVSKALRSLGVKVAEIDVRDKGFELPGDVDLAFITIHGTFGEDGQLQKILERRGVAYTGEGVEGSETAFDKIRTKEKFQEQVSVSQSASWRWSRACLPGEDRRRKNKRDSGSSAPRISRSRSAGVRAGGRDFV